MPTCWRVGTLVVDPANRRVTAGSRVLELTPKEFDFLAFVARYQGRVLTHQAILRQVWGPEAIGRTEYLRTYANQLRNKLGGEPGAPRLVTEPGVGYRLLAEE